MPITMGGVASGLDTDSIIEKLVNVEARPIKQLEADIKKNERRKEALQVLSNNLKELNDAAKELYGFRASYDEKIAVSSNPEFLDVRATKKADPGLRKIEIIQVASSHKLSTDPVLKTENIPAGKFTLKVNGNDYNIRFKGGKLQSLKERIDETASDSIATSLVRTSGDEEVLTLESKISGKKGEIIIQGDLDFLRKIGLASGPKGGEVEGATLLFDKRYFTSYMGQKETDKQTGNIKVSEDGKKISLNGLLWQEYTLPVSTTVSKDTLLEFTFTYQKPKKEEEEQFPSRLEMGPDEKITVKGIELNGYNVSRIRPPEEKKPEKAYDSLLGVGVVSIDEAGKREEKIYSVDKDAKGKQEMPVGSDFAGKKISKVIFYCNDGMSEFSEAKFATPVKDKDALQAKNEIAKPEDARLKVDGIEIIRDKNNDLGDVIKGLNLDLKMPSHNPITVKVDRDASKSIEKIKKFVEAYNNYISLHRELTKVERSSRPGDYENNLRKQGIFVGDMTLISLENMLKSTINGAYPSRLEKPIKILTQMGVSTGKVNAEWESIKEGKLQIDEGLLRSSIMENPEGVEVFFGSDTDGDNKTDNGMAYTLVSRLNTYVGFGKNVIASRIDLENESIKMANERIDRHTDHLKKYEAKLRQKFGTMEKAISGAKAQKSWMNQQLGNGDEGK